MATAASPGTVNLLGNDPITGTGVYGPAGDVKAEIKKKEDKMQTYIRLLSEELEKPTFEP